MKSAKWDSHKLPNRTIDTGYYAKDPHGDFYAIDFDFNTTTWGTIDFPANPSHQFYFTTPTPIALGLCIYNEERSIARSDWGPIDGQPEDSEDAPNIGSEPDNNNDTPDKKEHNSTDETELQKIAERS